MEAATRDARLSALPFALAAVMVAHGVHVMPWFSAVSAQSQAPAQPEVTLAPGLRPVPDYREMPAEVPSTSVPEGFTPIFNGRDLSGWHVSSTARHGTTPDFHVAHGMILGTQRPLGHGGLLITDGQYGDFELYMEVKPDWGNDSGIFFRTTEEGVAYQITMDYLPGGSMGRLIGEGGIQGLRASPVPGAATITPAPPPDGGRADAGMSVWNREDWNVVRLRVQGEAPRATVWINDQLVTDAAVTENYALGGAVEGPIAIQIHGGTARWQPGGFWRWRNIGIRDLSSD